MKRGKRATQERMFEFLDHPSWSAPAIGHNRPPELLETPPQPAWVEEAGWRFIRPLQALSLSMRGFVAAPAGKVFRVADFAQIEARVLAWLARCLWLLQAFKDKQDPYCKFAGEFMYNRPYDDYFEYIEGKRLVRDIFSRERQIAKSAVLGAGFGLGKRKFVEYCDNSNLIITEAEADRTISKYRAAHPEIVELWRRVELAAILATENPGERYQLHGTDVQFYTWHIDEERYWLCCQLPSGRCIHYYRPKIQHKVKWGQLKPTLTFRTEWNGQSFREDTYGGKIVENIVQAIARDILCIGGLNAEAQGYPVVMLVHDETVALTDVDFGSHTELCGLLCAQQAWITDLPVEAEGSSMVRYGK
jgi:DNA polymerase